MSESTCLRAGVARATVTPPVGVSLQGFAGRGPATGIHDPLYATALVLDDGNRKAVIVAGDLIYFDDDTTAAVRAETERRTGIPGAAIGLCASHTHYGPTMVIRNGQPGPDLAAYRANLVHLVAGAIQEAADAVTPVAIDVVRGSSTIGINRRERRPDGTIVLGRNPGGAIDRELIVVRIDQADGGPLATVVNLPVHGVCQSSQTRTVSADFVGPMRDLVEGTSGTCTLFLQGACGNINPTRMEPCFEPARALGTQLGAAVLMAYETAAPATPEPLVTTCSARLAFPALTYGTEAHTRSLRDQALAEATRLQQGNAAEGRLYWAQLRLDRLEHALASHESGVPLDPVEGEIMSVRFGHVAVTMTPGEIFSQIGRDVKDRSALADTLFVGYANGAIGYMPVPDAYAEGGYEVDRACRINPEAAAMLTDECLRQLEQLAESHI